MEHKDCSLEELCQILKACWQRKSSFEEVAAINRLMIRLRTIAKPRLMGVNRDADAEDVVNETLATLLKKGFQRYGHYKPFCAVVLKILFRICIDKNRRNRRDRVSASKYDRWHSRTPENDAIRRQHAGFLHDARDRLDARLSVVVDLRYFAGLTGAEIAEILGVPVATVNVWALKARAKMAGYLKGRGVRWDDL